MTMLQATDETTNMLCGVWATSREELLDCPAVIASHEMVMMAAPEGDHPFLRVRLPCGNEVTYQTKEDVPHESVRCGCEKDSDYPDGHWFIKYGEEGE